MSGRSSEHWQCPTCGVRHSGLATIFGPHVPDAWRLASVEQRAAGLIGPELCSLSADGRPRHFVRGHLELRVDDPQLTPFIWSVWVEIGSTEMGVVIDYWDAPDRALTTPLAGRLATDLPYPRPTIGLSARLFLRSVGEVPLVQLDPAGDHELVDEQAEGIAVHRVAEINTSILG